MMLMATKILNNHSFATTTYGFMCIASNNQPIAVIQFALFNRLTSLMSRIREFVVYAKDDSRRHYQGFDAIALKFVLLHHYLRCGLTVTDVERDEIAKVFRKEVICEDNSNGNVYITANGMFGVMTTYEMDAIIHIDINTVEFRTFDLVNAELLMQVQEDRQPMVAVIDRNITSFSFADVDKVYAIILQLHRGNYYIIMYKDSLFSRKM